MPVNNPHNAGSHLGEVESCRGPDIPKSLDDGPLSLHAAVVYVVVMPHGLCNPKSRDHICHGVLTGRVRRVVRTFQYFDHSHPKLSDPVDLVGLGRPEMPVEYPFLRVPNPGIFRNWDHFVDLIHIQVPPRTVITLEQRGHRPVPAFQDPFFSGVLRVEIDSGLGPSDGRA